MWQNHYYYQSGCRSDSLSFGGTTSRGEQAALKLFNRSDSVNRARPSCGVKSARCADRGAGLGAGRAKEQHPLLVAAEGRNVLAHPTECLGATRDGR